MNEILKKPDDNRFNRALTLLSLHRSLRDKKDAHELEFALVNDLRQLVSYRQCMFWEERMSGQIHIGAASGLIEIDQNAPYLVWLKSLVKRNLKKRDVEKRDVENPERITALSVDTCKPEDRAEWQKWSSAHVLLVIMQDEATGRHFGLWIDRQQIFTQPEQVMLDDLLDGFSYARKMISGRKPSVFSLSGATHMNKIMLAGLVLFLLFPIRLSVTAPAEIIARDPFYISAPFDGVVDQVLVHPNDQVEEGQSLAEMEQTQLDTAAQVAQQDLQAVRVSLEKTEREALYDPAKKVEINALRTQMQIKQMEFDYAKTRLDQSRLDAPAFGVAVFSDKNDWRGKPVRTGERIMYIADVKKSELLVRVPVDGMIDIHTDIPAEFFLNVSPLSSQSAQIKAIGYQATPDPDGQLSYKVRLALEERAEMPKIGWTGTAKLYGSRTIMAYYILRRPLIALRRLLNI